MNRPLLVVDGDSFAHRSYHALPKSIRRRGNKGGGAIVGFANFLLRLYAQEEPRAAGFRQCMVGAVRKRVAIDDEQRPVHG